MSKPVSKPAEDSSAAPHHVAIIGCGFAGTTAFFQLVDRYPVKKITIFEASGVFGPGYPYATDECPAYLMNNTSDSLCLVPSNRRAFLSWLESQPQYAGGLDPKGHMPRRVFGAFLEDVFKSTETVAAIKGIAVARRAEEATQIEERDGRVIVGGASGVVEADAAILTIGRCPDVDPFPHPPAGSRTRYIASHVRTQALDAIPLDAKVHILGASLSAYDVVNRLFAPDTGCTFERREGGLHFVPGANRRSVVICSRSGRLKSMQSRHPAAIDRRHFSPAAFAREKDGRQLSLADVAEAIVKEAAAHGADVDWRAVAEPFAGCTSPAEVNARAGELLAQAIDRATDPAARNFLVDVFVNAQLDIWQIFANQRLTPADEQTYRARYETAALTYAAPSALATSERLLALHRAGTLRIMKGVRGVSFDAAQDAYAIAHEHGVEIATCLVNTTGSLDRDVTSARQPALVRALVADGLLKPHTRNGEKLKGAEVDMETFRLPGSARIYLASMLLWGPGFFTSSAFVMAHIVERLLGAMYSPRA